MTREEYINYVDSNYDYNVKDIIKNQIQLFFDDCEKFQKTKYGVGDSVILEKGTYMHGIPGLMENFDWVVDNGFIGNDFTCKNVANKIKSSIGMWCIKDRIPLRKYVEMYSGFTITYTIGRGPGSKEVTEMIPYHMFDDFTEKLNDREDVWTYWGDQTKEIRFMPSLVSNKRQIAFIINTNTPSAKKLIKNDVWTMDMDLEIAKVFTDYRYTEKFLVERNNRNALTTDRETAIVFGLPSRLIEGVFVGRKVENDTEILNYIKKRLPDCYICNLDGKVIVGNNN